MEFKMSVEKFRFLFNLASTAMGEIVQFTSSDGEIRMVCSDGVTFTNVYMCDVEEDAVEESFGVNGNTLKSLLGTLVNGDSVEVKFDGVKVAIRSGSYCGDWFPVRKDWLITMPVSFAELFNWTVDERTELPKSEFVLAINRVKYATEGVANDGHQRIVFRRGKCWGKSFYKYHEVQTAFGEDVDIVIPTEGLGIVKFLELSGESVFGFKNDGGHLLYLVGRHQFVSRTMKAESGDKDDDLDIEKLLDPSKQVSFIKEAGRLQSAIIRASATCEPKSAEVHLEFGDNKLYVVGVDKVGNVGYDVVDVNLQGDLSFVSVPKVVGWHWVLPAIMHAGMAAVTIKVDVQCLVVESETARAVLTFAKYENVKRIINLK